MMWWAWCAAGLLALGSPVAAPAQSALSADAAFSAGAVQSAGAAFSADAVQPAGAAFSADAAQSAGAAFSADAVQSAEAVQSAVLSQDAGLSERAVITQEANLRTGPSTLAEVEAILDAGTDVTVVCWADGDSVEVDGENSEMWLYLSRGGWVHSLLTTPVDIPPCSGSGGTVLYGNCDEARDVGAAPVREGEAGYGLHLDRDRDGVGCEWD